MKNIDEWSPSTPTDGSQNPIYIEIAKSIEDAILNAVLVEEQSAPSSGKLAHDFNVSIGTAARALRLLNRRGVLQSVPGAPMVINRGAKQLIVNSRRGAFERKYLVPMMLEGKALGITGDELIRILVDRNTI